jgi:hypothetical protein
VNRVGAFVHEPPDVRSFLPTTGVPSTSGGLTLPGSGSVPGAGAITDVRRLFARSKPSAFHAVTTTRSVLPTSEAPSV